MEWRICRQDRRVGRDWINALVQLDGLEQRAGDISACHAGSSSVIGNSTRSPYLGMTGTGNTSVVPSGMKKRIEKAEASGQRVKKDSFLSNKNSILNPNGSLTS